MHTRAIFHQLAGSLNKTPLGLLLLLTLLAFSIAGCSIKKIAIKNLGDALAESGTTYASDNDPELIRGALPFSLKLIESILAESPRHRGLLLAASSGFMQYAFAFVSQDADEMEQQDFTRASEMRLRARNLFLRARDYGLRGLETRHKNFTDALDKDPILAVKATDRKDVPLLYWTAAAWGMAIILSKDEPELIIDQLVVEALIDRALELDEAYSGGSIHSFLILYEPVRRGMEGDPLERARRHFERSLELSGGFKAGPLVSMAETVCIAERNHEEFKSLLEKALAIDVDIKPEYRLENLVYQRRARWLLSRIDELFLIVEE